MKFQKGDTVKITQPRRFSDGKIGIIGEYLPIWNAYTVVNIYPDINTFIVLEHQLTAVGNSNASQETAKS